MGSTRTNSDDIDGGENQLEKRKRTKRLIYGTMGFGIAAYLVLLGVWTVYPEDAVAVGAVAVYWLGLIVGMGIYYRSSVAIEDERDEQIAAEAAGLTLTVAAFVLIVGGPGMVALEQTDVYEAPAAFAGAMWGYAILFGVFAVAMAYAERKHA